MEHVYSRQLNYLNNKEKSVFRDDFKDPLDMLKAGRRTTNIVRLKYLRMRKE